MSHVELIQSAIDERKRKIAELENGEAFIEQLEGLSEEFKKLSSMQLEKDAIDRFTEFVTKKLNDCSEDQYIILESEIDGLNLALDLIQSDNQESENQNESESDLNESDQISNE